MHPLPTLPPSSGVGLLERVPDHLASTGLLIRTAGAHDVEALVALRRVAGERAYAGLGADAVACWVAVRATQQHVTTLLANETGQLFVATDGGRVVGMGFVRRETRRVARLSDLYCDPPGRGAGSALLEERLAWARSRGATLARCNVFAANIEAQSFFHRRGFRVMGSEISDVVPGAPLLRHERGLG